MIRTSEYGIKFVIIDGGIWKESRWWCDLTAFCSSSTSIESPTHTPNAKGKKTLGIRVLKAT